MPPESVLASTDGAVWVASLDGLTKWKDGRFTVFRKANGLPDDATHSLFQDFRGRIWVTTKSGLAYFEEDRFIAVSGLPSDEVASITGDEAGNLWFSGNKGLSRWQNGGFVEHLPWSALGRQQQAKVVVADKGGVWLAFWDGDVLYLKDGQIRASYTTANGLGKGHVAGLRLDREGAMWAATQEGGLSRIQDGRINTLTIANGLPCNTIHWSIEDDSHSLWLNTACGLIRITRNELAAWLADPARKIETEVWDAADGVRLNAVSPAYFNPPIAKAADGKLWFHTGKGIQVVDPSRLAVNAIPPPVHIEHVIADHKTYDPTSGLRLPPLIRDLSMEFTALSLVAPEKVRFRYRLEGHDEQWHEAGDRRQAFYMNLAPGSYRFHVLASNNSGVWNEEGALLDFSIAPAFYQTTWFRLAFAVLLLALLWSGFQLHTRRLRREEKRLRNVIERIPALAFLFTRMVHPT